MREHMGLYRGKRKDNGEWVEGWYCKMAFGRWPLRDAIIPNEEAEAGNFHPYEVDPDTIGECTGLKANGKLIFEGDIISCWSEGVNAKGTVQRRVDGLWFIYPAWQKHIMWGLCPDKYTNTTVEIIGNIHDNPELLGSEVEYV